MLSVDEALRPSAGARPSSPPDALNAALRSRGFETRDFHLEEESPSPLVDSLGIVGGLLKIHCHSTAEERIYSTGPGSTWLGAFLMDLGRGRFAGATRRDDSNAVPISRPVQPRLLA